MKLFESYKLKNLVLRNRIVLPPMCMYAAGEDGQVTDLHKAHYLTRALGGTGLLIMEATGVLPEGRISDHCLGLWEDGQMAGLSEIVTSCQARGAAMGIQLNHAGRKCTAKSMTGIVAPSAIPFNEEYRRPRELSLEEIQGIVLAYQASAARAAAVGFDLLEIHGAHGYLISEFLSPLTNHRVDGYGGSLENRVRFLREVLLSVRAVWPADRVLCLRVSAHDYMEGGMVVQEMVEIIRLIRDLVDVVHVSSGGVVFGPRIDSFPGYQVPFAERIGKECQVPVICVGAIRRPELVEEILGNGRAPLVAMGRELLVNPNWVLQTAKDHGVDFPYPACYVEGFIKKR